MALALGAEPVEGVIGEGILNSRHRQLFCDTKTSRGIVISHLRITAISPSLRNGFGHKQQNLKDRGRSLKVAEIFTPNTYPYHTYVERDQDRVETTLREALMVPGEIVSVSGPSKSGKTVLIEKVVGNENLITISGGGLTDASQLWDKALDWMGAPTQFSEVASGTIEANATAAARGSFSLLGAKLGLDGGSGVSGSRSSGLTEVRGRTGLNQVVRDIANSSYVLLIDDFHYMPDSVQEEVARQIKEAARLGVKIVTASVPHRSDDVVRSNPELRGRVRAVNTSPWTVSELIRIAERGFPAAGLALPRETMEQFAIESSESPQLMQAICLQVCFTLKHYSATAPIVNRDLSPEEIRTAYEETSTRADFASLVRSMHAGPKVRGTERNLYTLEDGSRGDVYRALLLAIKRNPPALAFQWSEITRRIQATCGTDSPTATSLSTACAQVTKIAKAMLPNQGVLDWEGDPRNRLIIEDPYFLFFLRWSNKLSALGLEGST